MKLDWKRSEPDGERWFANVEEGQWIITLGLHGIWWPETIWLEQPLLEKAHAAFHNYGLTDVEKIKQQIELWYFSQGKEKGE
jgi:hypothetical protein